MSYIVYFKIAAIGKYIPYTSKKRPVSLEMAESLSQHLQRGKTASMIVEAKTGEIIKELSVCEAQP